MCNSARTFLCVSLIVLVSCQNTENGENYATDGNGRLTEHPGGTISTGVVIFNRTFSPYWLRNDIIIERGAKLIIEPGVVIKIQPQVGITVRGILIAKGTQDERIILTSAEEKSNRLNLLPDIRLVDGPTILAGRLQLKHKGEWRSVCTNSRNWTIADMETACRQLGFQGGSFFMWYDRLMPLKARLLYEQPNCTGIESSLFNCKWNTRQMGSGVCDYHPDLAIQCSPRHDRTLPFWRGLSFEYAEYERFLSSSRTLYVPKSLSELNYINIMYAGAGRDQNTTSAVEVFGVTPIMYNMEILNSAYNGINVTNSESPIYMSNCTVRNNRGYGVFINSSFGSAHIENSIVNENGGDGIRYIRAAERPDEKPHKFGYNDFCNFATTNSQIYPIQLFFEQIIYINRNKVCDKVFNTRYNELLTLYIVRAVTSRNESSLIEIYDGTNFNKRLIKSFPIRNNTRPQAITTTQSQMYVKFEAEPFTQTVVFFRITSGPLKVYDLNVSSTEVSDNLGRGIVVEELRSQLHVHKSTVSKNQYVAGVHVASGVGDVNVTESRLSFNNGDGINITYTGGSRNISRSSISSNQGYGIAIWLNKTRETEYIFINQSTVLQYSEIYKNIDTGVLHGNFCGPSFFNFSSNIFRSSLSDALEIQSCWAQTIYPTNLQVGHNIFQGNDRISLRITPALNLKARIEYNHFRSGTFGAILIKNKPLEQFNILASDIIIQQNYFLNNTGIFVVNLALSPYALYQHLMFTRNFVKNNKIIEPFQPEDGSISNLVPRSRVAAPVVIGSSNVVIFRNIIENSDSKYEIGSHLEDQSKIINCTFNWLGYGSDEYIFHRIFHRYDRYNLAKILFIPFLLHNSNPLTNKYGIQQTYVPKFSTKGSNKIGGEIEGEEFLSRGEYVVEKDISIRPGGKLTLEPGVTLRFPASIGMLVGGRLEARGMGPDSIKLTLKEEISHAHDNETIKSDLDNLEFATEILPAQPRGPIRLLGGSTETMGRLQVKINNEWGTVCNYGWTQENAALVCQQLGFVLNPDDWIVERSDLPEAGTTEKVLLSNVQCDDIDLDITKCKAEQAVNFENSCTHENDVGIKCYKTSWAGVRFAGLAERSNIQYLTIEQSGLLDYATKSFKPALQLDFARHNFENIKITNNFQDGLGILYSDIYTDDTINIVKNSEFTNNKGAGISLKQFGLNVYGSVIEGNKIGIKHDSSLTGLQQREFTGWFVDQEESFVYRPILIPYNSKSKSIDLQHGETKYLVTQKVDGDSIVYSYTIRCDPGWVIGIQLLNPIENRSTEEIFIKDSLTMTSKSDKWSLKRDLTVFPTTSSSYGIILEYNSGINALGGTVIVLSNIRAPVQNVYNKIVKGPIPTLTVHRSKIRNNEIGIMGLYYNRYLDELGNHYLRKANETFKCIYCDISHNRKEAILIESPNWDLHKSNISETVIMINNSLITDNGHGIYHFSRDMRQSNNLFHYILQDDTVERNKYGGFDVRLPYVWQYNENFTHSIYIDNNTWSNNRELALNIDGHYAVVNITRTKFNNNYCKTGLLSIKGMEKKLLIVENKFNSNNAKFLVQFNLNSQSEIIGNVPAIFMYNELRNNRYIPVKIDNLKNANDDPTSVISFKGIQKVNVRRNLMSNNELDFQLVAGIITAKINNTINVAENWWGSADLEHIKQKIFDFTDWNNHAIAEFQPYLLSNDFEASFSTSYRSDQYLNVGILGGPIYQNLTLKKRDKPYRIMSDITVMPGAILTIEPGVVMEFPPSVGILVLGTLKARGYSTSKIIMKPIEYSNDLKKRKRRSLERLQMNQIRLCKDMRCQDEEGTFANEGFLEYFNTTTFQWVPMCDPRFTERNAQVVCRELGFDPLNSFFAHDIRIDFHSNSLSRIWSWPEPLQCEGTESRYEDCPIRLNGQQYGHKHICKWNSKFVFVNCGDRVTNKISYWGGIRFADPLFEEQLFIHRLHDVHTHNDIREEQSVMQFVEIIGAGILHNEKSPAIQGILKSPKISYVKIKDTASHGINFISPPKTLSLLHNHIENSMGVGINILSLTGEGRESEHSSFSPLRDLNIPYQLFGLVDICDPHKELVIEEKMLVYYKYDNHPVNCIKIFKSAFNVKRLGFRLLQFNLFNSTNKFTVPDFISLYDGDIYNVTSTKMAQLTMGSQDENAFYRTKLPSLSVKLFANGASSNHGFFAEVVTLPISAIGFNRDVQHNISYSSLVNNREGALLYMSAGEVNPIVTIEKNQFKTNCKKFYGNFTTCRAAIEMDVQNTESIFFRGNLIEGNQGGLSIRSDSSSSATSLKGYVQNNLFVNNTNLPTLNIEGRQSSPYQEVILNRNYFTRNVAQYVNNIILKQVVSSFTHNYVKRNIGLRNLEISGFDRVRLPIFQTTSHNGFYNNYAVSWDSRSTIIAGTAGQQYVDNIFSNPDNDYEILTVNRSLFDFNSSLQQWNTKIDAISNYWGVNNTLAVGGRIRDQTDDPRLLEVTYVPYLMNNRSILNDGKCPPGWNLVGQTCYIYIGAPMTFYEAKEFCEADNATMPYIVGTFNYLPLYEFIKKQNKWHVYSEKVWVQHIDKINECTMFAYQTIDVVDCELKNAFICEIDPQVTIRIIPLTDDIVTLSIVSGIILTILILVLVMFCWWMKSKYRQKQRLERRNSIRTSVHSLRSLGMTPSAFSDPGYRRKMGQLSTRSTDTLTKGSDFRKIVSNGSIDSMEKSAYNSSIEDSHSVETYESQNPNPPNFAYNMIELHKSPARFENQYAKPMTFDLGYKNDGYRDNSTFASTSNFQSGNASVDESSVNDDETPIMHSHNGRGTSYPPSDYYNTDTLPLTDSYDKIDDRREEKLLYDPKYSRDRPNKQFLYELKQKIPKEELPPPPEPPKSYSDKIAALEFSPDYNTVGLAPFDDRPSPSTLLETDIDTFSSPSLPSPPRAKSEVLLETNFDYAPEDSPIFNHPISNRSKSQPLETAM